MERCLIWNLVYLEPCLFGTLSIWNVVYYICKILKSKIDFRYLNLKKKIMESSIDLVRETFVYIVISEFPHSDWKRPYCNFEIHDVYFTKINAETKLKEIELKYVKEYYCLLNDLSENEIDEHKLNEFIKTDGVEELLIKYDKYTKSDSYMDNTIEVKILKKKIL